MNIASSYAQKQGQALVDSLLKEIPKAKEDTNKVELLSVLSRCYNQVNPGEGVKYGLQSLELATKLRWKKGIGYADIALGANYEYLSDYPKAMEYFRKGLETNKEMGDKYGIASANCNIGNLYNLQCDYAKALEFYFKALAGFEEIRNKNGIADVTTNIASIYAVQKNYPKALEFLFKALKLDEEMGYKRAIPADYCNIGQIYGEGMKDYPKALEYLFKALELNEESGDKTGIIFTAGNIGNVYTNQKNYIMAIEYYGITLKTAEEMGDKARMGFILSAIGSLYLSIIEDTSSRSEMVPVTTEFANNKYQPASSIPEGNPALLRGAINYFQQSLAIARVINDPVTMQNSYFGLAKAYKLSGDYKKALEASDWYNNIKDSIFSKENREQLVKLEMKHEYDRQRFTDSMKTAEKERLTTMQLDKQKSYTYLGIMGILLLAGFSFFIVKERSKSEKERKKSDGLLLNILPVEVAEELKVTGATTAKHYDSVTVLFTDFINFTNAGERMKPQGLIEELHTCFKAFDEITGKYKIEKIKTIGDAYMAVCGLPSPDPKHAENIVRAAIEINNFMQDRLAKLGSSTFEIRIGINSGSVVAGIVGVKKFAYDIWGDTVNTAARMEQNSEPGKINVSQTTYELVKDKFDCEYRGEIDAKNKGKLKMYFIS